MTDRATDFDAVVNTFDLSAGILFFCAAALLVPAVVVAVYLVRQHNRRTAAGGAGTAVPATVLGCVRNAAVYMMWRPGRCWAA